MSFGRALRDRDLDSVGEMASDLDLRSSFDPAPNSLNAGATFGVAHMATSRHSFLIQVVLGMYVYNYEINYIHFW